MGKIRDKLNHPQIIQGMTLGTLFKVIARNGFRVDTQYLGRLAQLMALGVFNSIFAGCETFFNIEEIRKIHIEQAPLFVIGHWRSGTTHLHNLLNLDARFTCPTAYQALFPRHFVFSQIGGAIFDLIAPRKRPMDDVAFSSKVPHEDEFALAADCGVSPYTILWFPRTKDRPYSELDHQRLPSHALEEWKQSFILFLKKLTLSEEGRIVLKSPPHLGRMATILEIFPEAQFVHIVRNPYAVYRSMWKLWNDSLAYSCLQAADRETIDELILSWYEELFSLFERDRDQVPQGALHEMKYEDLEEKPLETMQSIYETLGLSGFEPVRDKMVAYLESIKNYQKNPHQFDEASREKVAKRWRFTFERYQYDI
jgi:hypothetical protein